MDARQLRQKVAERHGDRWIRPAGIIKPCVLESLKEK
jgi:hypothetical protein